MIFPNLNSEEGFNHGIACLSGALKARGHDVVLINLNESLYPVPTDQQLVHQVHEHQAQAVLFSVQTMQYPYALRLARAIRTALPEVPLIVGGVHATLCREKVIADKLWDYIGMGECDHALPELIDRLQAGRDVENVPNFAVRLADGTYRVNPLGPYPNLEELPPEDFEIFDLDHMLAQKNGWLSMLTSRGCPYRCSYCFNYELAGKYAEQGHPRKQYLRRYRVDQVIEQIRQLKARHDAIETIIFDDDLFTLDTDWCVQFADRYVEAGLDIPFVVNAHVQCFNERIAAALARAPCKIVKFGVEAGSESLRRDVLKRFMTNRQIVDAFELAHKHGLHTSAFVMFGMPGETVEQIFETIDLIVALRPGRMRWSVFYPFPGTVSYQIAEERGLIDHEKLKRLDNYFVATCLKFDPAAELFINKLQRIFHWYVNARLAGPAAQIYRDQIKAVEAIPAEAWGEARDQILKIDRQISEDLLTRGVEHYSIRYTEVMAVHSAFVMAEQGPHKHQQARAWRETTKT